MTYAARETGIATGQPVELYLWTHVDEVYAYTSAQVQQTFGSVVYAPLPMRRGRIGQNEEPAHAMLDVEVGQAHPVAQLFRLGPPIDIIRLILRRRHAGESDAQTISPWRGRVLSCEWSGSVATLRHEPTWTSIRRPGVRRTWGYQCPHVFGGPHGPGGGPDEDFGPCGVDLRDYDVSGTVVSVSGVTVEVNSASSQANGYWTGGMLEHVSISTGRTLRAAVVGHAGDVLTIDAPIGFAAGDVVTIYPGCPHTLDGCRLKANYGGFPWTPQRTPYGGTPIY